MQNPARIPNLVARERFIRRVIAEAVVYLVSGDVGWAGVPFRHDPTRNVVMAWSSRSEAERWADVVATAPTVHPVPLATLMCDLLPMLADRRSLIGFDWCTEPADPVIAPTDLAERLWRERSKQFLAKVRAGGAFWVLESATGPAFLPSQRMPGKEFLPVWAGRVDAEAHIAGSWAVKRPLAVSMDVFRDRYMPYLDQRGWLVGPEPMAGAGSREMTVSELANRLFAATTPSQLRAV